MIVQGLWDHKVEAIIDVKLGDTDADLYKYEPTAVLLAWWETIKKDKNGKHCHDQQKTFVLSVDGITGGESLVVLSQLIQVMEAKRD